jgi:hypothetical protein
MVLQILALIVSGFFLQDDYLKVDSPTTQIQLFYIKERPAEVAFLTKKNPVKIEVVGPTWIKIDTRIPWHNDMEGEQRYSIIVQEDDIRETIFRKKTFISDVIFGRNGKRYGESRYSLINVPSGKHVYTFFLWEAAPDTVLLSFSLTEQRFWSEIVPTRYSSSRTIIGKEERQQYYTVSEDSSIEIEISSPITIKVLARLNFDETMVNEQQYKIIVKEKEKKIKEVIFDTKKSNVYRYENTSTIIPSKEDKFFLWFARGDHTLSFHLENAKSASLCFLKEESNK